MFVYALIIALYHKCISLFFFLTKGYVTMILQCSVEMHATGYAWRGLKEQLGEDIDNKLTRMCFLKGKMVRNIFFLPI